MNSKQTVLFDAVSGIDAEYIEEAIIPAPAATHTRWKRIAAVAAVFIIFGILGPFLLPSESDVPTLAIRAHAASSMDSQLFPIDYQLTPSGPHLSFSPYRPPSSWGDANLFCFGIWLEDIPRQHWGVTTRITVEYAGKTVDEFSNDSNVEIIPSLSFDPKTKTDIMIAHVYGWLSEDTELTIRVYLETEGGSILFHTQTVQILTYDGYVMKILHAEQAQIDWSELS